MLRKQTYKLGGSNPNIPARRSVIGDDLFLADQEPENENDDVNNDDVNGDDVNDDDVNVENNQEQEESSSDEEDVQINFIDEDEQLQQPQPQPQLLQDVIREQQLIQALESQLAGERRLLRMLPNNELIRNSILNLQQQINNLRRGNTQSGGKYYR